MASNTGRYKTFQNSQTLHGPSGAGQNLNEDLQRRLGDDLDGLVQATAGDGVVSGWVVAAGAGLAVTITAGEGFAGGQRAKSTGAGGVASLPSSTAGIKIFVAAGSPWDGSTATWPTSFGFTVGALGAGQLLLAEVTTDGSGVTAVVDKRTLVQTHAAMIAAPNDSTAPAASAVSVLQRFSMLATRIKEIMGTAGWTSAVPLTLAAIAAAFHATTGHKHTGGTGDAPKLAQADTHVSPDTDAGASALHHTLGSGVNQAAPGNHGHAASAITFTPTGGIAASTVQNAIAEVDAEKALLVHTHDAGDIPTGAFAPARLGTGSPTGDDQLFGDGVWRRIPRLFGPSWVMDGRMEFWEGSNTPVYWTPTSASLWRIASPSYRHRFALGVQPIAPTATHLTTSSSTTDAQSYNTASVSPGSNRLVLVWVVNTKTSGGAPDTPTLSGNGLTWVQVTTLVDSTNIRRLTLFRAMGASPSSGAITITVPGSGNTGCAWSVVEFNNVNRGGTNGSAAVKANTTYTTSSDLAAIWVPLVGRTLAAGFCGGAVNSGVSYTKPNHTVLGSTGFTVPTVSLATTWVGHPDKGAFIRWTTSSGWAAHIAIVVELDPDPALAVTPATSYALQRVDTLRGFPPLARWQGRQVTLGAWVYATAANSARIATADGVAFGFSDYHPGDATWRFLTVTATLSGSATQAAIVLVNDTNALALFTGVSLVWGAVLADYLPEWFLPQLTPTFGFNEASTLLFARPGVLGDLIAQTTVSASTLNLIRVFKNGNLVTGVSLLCSVTGAAAVNFNNEDVVICGPGDYITFAAVEGTVTTLCYGMGERVTAG